MGQNTGFTDPLILTAFAVSAIAFAAFFFIEQRVAEPMLNLDLFRSRDLTVNLVTGFVSFFALSGLLLVVPFYLTDVMYLSPREIGLVLGAVPITMGIVAPLSGSLSDRVGSRPVTVTGLVLMTIAYGLAALLIADTTTTRSCPSPRKRATLSATCSMRSMEPTEVPPNFWTIRLINLCAARFQKGRY